MLLLRAPTHPNNQFKIILENENLSRGSKISHAIKFKSGKRGRNWSQIFSILYFMSSLSCKYKSKFKKLGNMAIQYFRANFRRRNKLCDIQHHRNSTAYLNNIYSMYIRWSRMDMCIISGTEHGHEMI